MKIALIGYGKMGRAVEKIALEQGHEVMLRADSSLDLRQATAQLHLADAAIEFSRPAAAFQNVAACLEAGIPVVSGTTGWNDRLADAVQLCSEKEGAFFHASNFSVGMHLFMEVNRMLARLVNRQPQYELRIEETHHIQKLDAPSGTAVTLAELLLRELESKTHWTKEETSPPKALPIISHRQGEVPGIHSAVYTSPIDTITLTHEAHSREGFAAGALQAAGWIIGRKGFFGMRDMLATQA